MAPQAAGAGTARGPAPAAYTMHDLYLGTVPSCNFNTNYELNFYIYVRNYAALWKIKYKKKRKVRDVMYRKWEIKHIRCVSLSFMEQSSLFWYLNIVHAGAVCVQELCVYITADSTTAPTAVGGARH